MKIKQIWSVFFSATGTTRKIVMEISAKISENLTTKKLPAVQKTFDFTLPEARVAPLSFTAEDLVIFGTPVIAGRVPNVLLKYLDTLVGGGAAAVPVAVYGNRNFDDALIELRDILEKGGFHSIAAAAFVGEHSFSETLAKGRPDESDMRIAQKFAESIADKVSSSSECWSGQICVPGTPFPYRGYYQPRDRHGNPIDIRKVKPVTDSHCTGCMICADICPMGSINRADVKEIPGICIKCCACIKKCPQNAKRFEDAGYLYHKLELEEMYERRAEPQLFL